MATLDLASAVASSEVFSANYTIPQIRAIHRSLHVQIDEKASRLRTQVGGSYRELLGTADTIVHMRRDNDSVQELLGRMGGRCGRAVVGTKVAGLDSFVNEAEKVERSEGSAGVGDTARLRLLEACGLAIRRVLGGHARPGAMASNKGDRLILATKILVLTRLLIKSFGNDVADARIQRAVENAKRSHGTLRQRLLRSIEKVLERGGEHDDTEDVLNALCAYSLATNSGTRDVFKHFLRVRGEAMALAFEVAENEREKPAEDVLTSLSLYTRTILDVQKLVPFKLSEALVELKKHALLADESLKQLEGLRLDIYERWCGDEIQFFTPFIRHDDLDGNQAREMLASWAAKGAEVLIQGLKKTMERMTEFKAVTELRTNVLQHWIRDGGRAKGFDPSEMLEHLRSALRTHMLKVLDNKVSKLHLVGSEISATLETWQPGTTDKQPGIWDEDAFDMSLPHGAGYFMQEVVARIHGRNDSVSRAIKCYQSWHHVIDEVQTVVDQLRKQRWDNDIHEIEDEETIEARQQLLSKNDPKSLHERLDSCLENAFKSLDGHIAKMWKEQECGPNGGPVAMYLLRILRDIRSDLPKLESVKGFGLPLVPSLHRKLASTVTASSLDSFAATSLTRKTVAGRSLWEGDPQLPTQPTPGTFSLLRNLSEAMSSAGEDLWSPTALMVMKHHLRTRLCEMWLEAMATQLSDAGAAGEEAEKKSEEEEQEADTDKEPVLAAVTPEQRRDLFTQWLYDISYLRCCIGAAAEGAADEFKSVEEAICQRAEMESAAARQRLAKSSQDYWKRTSLLFGLLA